MTPTSPSSLRRSSQRAARSVASSSARPRRAIRGRPEPRSSASRGRRPRRSTAPSCSSGSARPPAGCASSRPSPPRCRRRSRVEDVSRTCLEHATTGVGALAGLVVLRGHGVDAALDRVVGRLGDRARRPGRRDPGRGRGADPAQPREPAVRPRSTTAGSRSRSPAVRSALQLPSADLSDADREWLLTLVSQGEQALDRAGRYETERGIAETMQRSVLPERLPDGQRRHAGGPLPARHGRGRRRRRLVRHHPARGRLASASSSATWSARAFRPRR